MVVLFWLSRGLFRGEFVFCMADNRWGGGEASGGEIQVTFKSFGCFAGTKLKRVRGQEIVV